LELRFFEIYRDAEYLTVLAEGALVSVLLTIGGGAVGLALAMALAAAQFARVPVLHPLASAYVEFIRNTPLIVQLFFVTFGLPLLLGYRWPFWAHAWLAFSLNFSAYFAAIIRSGLDNFSRGQFEAARALGISYWRALLRLAYPQALAHVYPSLNSQFIFLFLTTGVVSQIGVQDLTWAGLYVDARTFRSFEVFIVLTIVYVLIALAFKALLARAQDALFPWWQAR
jgi:polar amino acid transport system permease protein